MRVVIVGLGMHREFGLMSLRRAGHSVGVVDDLRKIPTESVDWWVAKDRDRLTTAQELAAAIEPRGCDVVLCWDEMLVTQAAEVARVLRALSAVLDPVVVRDKFLMRSRLKEAGLRTPVFKLVTAGSDGVSVSEGMTMPVVVKPADGAGSTGVELVTDVSGLEGAIARAVEISSSGRCLIEEFIEGEEVSVETISWGRGHHMPLGITAKSVGAPPYFVEMGHVFPAPLSPERRDEVLQVVAAALDSLGIEVGASHAEVKLSACGPTVVEVAGRLAGDYIPRLVYEATGADPYLLELDAICCAAPPSLRWPEPRQVAAIRFFGAAPGRPVRWPALSEVECRELRRSLIDLKWWHPALVTALPVDRNGRRLGYCIMAGLSTDVALAYEAAAALTPQPIGAPDP